MQRFLLALAVPAMLVFVSGGANEPEAPVSQYASVEDLVTLINEYGERVGEAVVSQEEFEAKGSRMVRDARTLAVLATALGLSDQDHPLKAAAPGIVAASKKTAESGDDLAAAQEAVESLKKALAGEAQGGEELSWDNTKALGQLMKQVNFVHTRLKRNAKKLDKFQEQCAQDATLLSVIGQATRYDTHEVKDDAKLPDWNNYAIEMRDASAALAAAIKSGDAAAVEAGMTRVVENCDACHHTFPHD